MVDLFLDIQLGGMETRGLREEVPIMFRARWLSAIALFTILLIGRANGAYAQSFVTVTKCDTVTVNGEALYRVTFSVHNYNPNYIIAEIVGHPTVYQTPGDTCRAIQVTGPSGWIPVALADRGPAWATSSNFIYSGQTLEGFSFVLKRGTCCYDIAMDDQFFQTADFEHLCFTCPLATPTRAFSWGRVRVVYR